MKIAKSAKQRLSDVVMATRQYLDNLEGGRLFAYLKKLVSLDKDYARLVGQRKAEHKVRFDTNRLKEARKQLAGKYFTSKERDVFIHVEPSGMLSIERGGVFIGCRPMDTEFLKAIDDGRLTKTSF